MPSDKVANADPAAHTLDELYQSLKRDDHAWLERTIRDRWRQRQQQHGAQYETSIAAAQPSSVVEDCLFASVALAMRDVTAIDCLIDEHTSDHFKRIRTLDWSSTDLGPMSTWPLDLRIMVNLCLSDNRAVALWRGPNKIGLYNEAYAKVISDRDHWALGSRYDEIWPDKQAVDIFNATFKSIEDTGLPYHAIDQRYFLGFAGVVTEFWSSWSILPFPSLAGSQGYFNILQDTSAQMIRNRRTAMLLSLQKKLTGTDSLAGFAQCVLDGLDPYPEDIPFALVYTRDQEEHDTGLGEAHWTLHGTLPAGAPAFQSIAHLDLAQADKLFGAAFQKAEATGVAQVIEFDSLHWPDHLREGCSSRIWHERSSKAMIVPVNQVHPKALASLLVYGISPRVRQDHEDLASLLTHHLTLALHSLMISVDRHRLIAVGEALALSEQQLADKLLLAEHDVVETEARFRKMADHAPTAIFEVAPTGEILYANDIFFSITGFQKGTLEKFAWRQVIYEEDLPWFELLWLELNSGDGKSHQFDIRFRKPFVSDDYVDGQRLQGETWVAVSCYPELNGAGQVQTIFGTFAEISRHKWMQGFQERRAAEALELKRQQETFMDMISHEARNPLAAITLCAEDTLVTLGSFVGSSDDCCRSCQGSIHAAIEDAKTILACATHQKSIIDDVLTLSKIDAGMLPICPVQMQPHKVVEDTMRIFENEVSQAGLDLQCIVDASYYRTCADSVLLDPVRLQQILINLVSNAIKFTKDVDGAKKVVIRLAAQADCPRVSRPRSFMATTPTKLAKHGSAEEIYLTVTVQDSGVGIKAEDLESLFQRFHQGSPKTHVKYGGSGLGLYICKTLAGLQGGAINVESTYGEGSTFSFYVKAELCSPSEADDGDGQHKKRSKLDTEAAENKSGVVMAWKEAKHILLVEDNLVNQRVMAKQLRRVGHVVMVASHGQEALEFLQTTSICRADGPLVDAVLMDIEMPVMNGLDCTRQIRAMEQRLGAKSRLAVIAVTANARTEQQNVALEAGCDAVITKPFRMAELRDMLSRVSERV